VGQAGNVEAPSETDLGRRASWRKRKSGNGKDEAGDRTSAELTEHSPVREPIETGHDDAESASADRDERSPRATLKPATDKHTLSLDSKPSTRSSAALIKIAGGLVAVVIVGYLSFKQFGPDSLCDKTLAQAAERLAGSDVAGGKSLLVQALASCHGDGRQRAVELQGLADKAAVSAATCDRVFQRISGAIAGHRLGAARKIYEEVDPTCTTASHGKQLLEQLEREESLAASAAAAARKALDSGDASAAREAINLLASINRDEADIHALRERLDAMGNTPAAQPTISSPTVPPAISVQTHTPIQVIPPAGLPPAQSPEAKPAPTAPSSPPAGPAQVNLQAEMAQGFIRDAERALAEMKFDAAKTYVASARKLDPGNPQAADLLRRISAREMQYLRDETTIK
jgi:hypothetical protein